MKDTFIHRFRFGIVATLTLEYKPGRGLDSMECHCYWNKHVRPAKFRKIFEDYKLWRTASFQAFKEKHGIESILVLDLM